MESDDLLSEIFDQVKVVFTYNLGGKLGDNLAHSTSDGLTYVLQQRVLASH